MTSDVRQIADLLEAEFGESLQRGHAAISSLYADVVDIHHVPPLPTDGPTAIALLRQLSEVEGDAVRRALPDLSCDDINITVDGSRIRVQMASTGTLPSGGSVSLNSDIAYSVRDGRIVGMETRFGTDAGSSLREVFAAGNFQMPDDLRDHYAAHRDSSLDPADRNPPSG